MNEYEENIIIEEDLGTRGTRSDASLVILITLLARLLKDEDYLSYSLVLAWDDSQMRTKINPPTRSVARKKDPELQPITASLLISISKSVILTEAPK